MLYASIDALGRFRSVVFKLFETLTLISRKQKSTSALLIKTKLLLFFMQAKVAPPLPHARRTSLPPLQHRSKTEPKRFRQVFQFWPKFKVKTKKKDLHFPSISKTSNFGKNLR